MPYAKTYYTDFSSLLEPSMLEKKLPLVPPERQERIETAKRPETKSSLLAAGLLLNTVMKQEYNISAFEVAIANHGKPYLVGHEDIHFNLSHSGTIAVCTVSDTEVGVDIEKTDAPHDMMGVANRFFSLLEYNAMLMSYNPKEAFCRLWTLRESYVKMRGMGFAIGLSTLRCDFHRGICTMYEKEVPQHDAFFHELREIDGYRGAVCTKSDASHSLHAIEL